MSKELLNIILITSYTHYLDAKVLISYKSNKVKINNFLEKQNNDSKNKSYNSSILKEKIRYIRTL